MPGADHEGHEGHGAHGGAEHGGRAGHRGPGRVVDGRFELLERLGSGGMGTVWRARDTVLDRQVALKEVRPPDPALDGDGGGGEDGEGPASRRLRERVLREARALARISHPHVVTVHHIVDSRPHPWIVMELLPGRSLQDLLGGGPPAPREVARIGRQLLSALRAAHAAGILHRDVKPANVLLRPDGSAVLTDFGIAALRGSASLTMTGEIIGSPEYIAPERIRGDGGDTPAADLWSLAMTLYVCAEGVSPLRRGSALATLAAVLDDPVPEPVRAGPLAPALTAMLVRDPAARPDAERFDALLAAAEAGPDAGPASTVVMPRPPASVSATSPPSPAPVPPGTPTAGTGVLPAAPGRPARRRAMTAAGAVAAVAVLLAAGVYGVTALSGGDERRNTGARPAATTSPGDGAAPDGKPAGAGADGAADRTSGTGSAPASPDGTGAPEDGAPSADASPDSGEASADSWIAQLFSEPVSSGTAARDERLASVRAQVPGARVLRSDDFAALRPGYWVIYAPGPFADGNAAVRYCAEHGRTTSDGCVGRYLSHDPADRVYVCHPDSGGSGRCTRP
ncbi:protein kinase [Streptomyces sp. TRM 70361]|uniref:serine/threonine-protein kinase n=1 Tax=Streptomyces sp. TRM 70361 TaxID=3116553 RepID=UPI002E7B7E61|nr:protein kinase [Streptomyces sp. TRM 70361]MEE1942250.1 protein kinase [Streptomyces sp. TRM 70361]